LDSGNITQEICNNEDPTFTCNYNAEGEEVQTIYTWSRLMDAWNASADETGEDPCPPDITWDDFVAEVVSRTPGLNYNSDTRCAPVGGGEGEEPNPCQDVDCGGHGSCSGGTCVCESGAYTGDHCENFDPCFGIDCGNNGTCSDEGETYTCTCNSGYYFDNVNTNTCVENECQCTNGTISSATCTENGAENCGDCNAGYHLDEINHTCVENVCTCPETRGTGAIGVDCPTHGTPLCGACINNWEMVPSAPGATTGQCNTCPGQIDVDDYCCMYGDNHLPPIGGYILDCNNRCSFYNSRT